LPPGKGRRAITARRSVDARVIRIAITAEAFEAFARTLALGSVSYENKTNERGDRLIWLDRAAVDRLRSLRGPNESYGDVILRLASERVV
jgi:hypothetical protein